LWQQLSEKERKYELFYRQMLIIRAFISIMRYKVSGFRESRMVNSSGSSETMPISFIPHVYEKYRPWFSARHFTEAAFPDKLDKRRARCTN
jgi:hypothetical protein